MKAPLADDNIPGAVPVQITCCVRRFLVLGSTGDDDEMTSSLWFLNVFSFLRAANAISGGQFHNVAKVLSNSGNTI
jgi:hypothetical protein